MVAYVDSLKLAIVHKADGSDGDPDNILNRDDLEAAAVVMLAPGKNRGMELRRNVENYREYMAEMMDDSLKGANIREALNTDPIQRAGTLVPQQWEEAKFDQQPVVAAVTLLTKLQNDILYAEGEVLGQLLNQVDAGDVRVNELNAYVMPQSRLVMRGGKYSANIVLAAVDTTQRPVVVIDGTKLSNEHGLYEVNTGSTGKFSYSGYLEVPHGDGSTTRHPFSSDYTVIEPMATVSASMMNVLYAGIDNPVGISVPGVAMNDISATMTNGSLTRSGDHWIARPSAVGTFRDAQGNIDAYKGGRGFAKTLLLQAPGLEAAIDDGLIDTKFRVLSFETVFFDSMGNAIPEVSDGASFSARQRQSFQRLQRGKRFYISRIKAVGPDGITRDLSPMEVIVN